MSARIRAAAKAAAGARARGAARSRGLWVEVEPGFHVGNDRRQFLGSVTGTLAEGFTAFGPQSDFVGRFPSLDEAKAAVAAASASRPDAGAAASASGPAASASRSDAGVEAQPA
ncbi:hypothetical protein [Microbacterium sp. H83]|uniref:hypothetical protein n=1 Tax=Microbacterium sp. H83 TaxID=1827324 RepID=UPI000AD721C3|nr:hypothetical protein [Microbacterium sp. H83]